MSTLFALRTLFLAALLLLACLFVWLAAADRTRGK